MICRSDLRLSSLSVGIAMVCCYLPGKYIAWAYSGFSRKIWLVIKCMLLFPTTILGLDMHEDLQRGRVCYLLHVFYNLDLLPPATPVTVSPERRKSGYSKPLPKPAVCHCPPSTGKNY